WRDTVPLRRHCGSVDVGALHHKGQCHQEIDQCDDYRGSKGMFEEPLDMKSDDTRQAAEHQSLGAHVLWRQISIYAPGTQAVGQPYPQPAGQTEQSPFRCYLHDIVVQMPNASGRINRAVRFSVVMVHAGHSTHTNPCPGMVTDHVPAAGPHRETLLRR